MFVIWNWKGIYTKTHAIIRITLRYSFPGRMDSDLRIPRHTTACSWANFFHKYGSKGTVKLLILCSLSNRQEERGLLVDWKESTKSIGNSYISHRPPCCFRCSSKWNMAIQPSWGFHSMLFPTPGCFASQSLGDQNLFGRHENCASQAKLVALQLAFYIQTD